MEKKRVKCFLIRHAKTKGNLEGRYIGSRTDESLCKEGIAELEEKRSGILHGIMQDKKDDFHLVSSPMKRCKESAELLFSRKADEIAEELRETIVHVPELSNLRGVEIGGSLHCILSLPDGCSPGN